MTLPLVAAAAYTAAADGAGVAVAVAADASGSCIFSFSKDGFDSIRTDSDNFGRIQLCLQCNFFVAKPCTAK